MNDKSPRQHSSKKPAKTIKEKRLDKVEKAVKKVESEVVGLFPNKQHRAK